jgi:hypothetical protein
LTAFYRHVPYAKGTEQGYQRQYNQADYTCGNYDKHHSLSDLHFIESCYDFFCQAIHIQFPQRNRDYPLGTAAGTYDKGSSMIR